MSIQEKQLGQLRPTDTTAASLYSPGSSTTWVAKSLIVCNTTGSAATFRIFHDEDGTTYDETTALYFDKSVPANDSIEVSLFLAGSNSSGNVAARTDTANALNFTLYGAEIT
jgi:hypothetical protein